MSDEENDVETPTNTVMAPEVSETLPRGKLPKLSSKNRDDLLSFFSEEITGTTGTTGTLQRANTAGKNTYRNFIAGFRKHLNSLTIDENAKDVSDIEYYYYPMLFRISEAKPNDKIESFCCHLLSIMNVPNLEPEGLWEWVDPKIKNEWLFSLKRAVNRRYFLFQYKFLKLYMLKRPDEEFEELIILHLPFICSAEGDETKLIDNYLKPMKQFSKNFRGGRMLEYTPTNRNVTVKEALTGCYEKFKTVRKNLSTKIENKDNAKLKKEVSDMRTAINFLAQAFGDEYGREKIPNFYAFHFEYRLDTGMPSLWAETTPSDLDIYLSLQEVKEPKVKEFDLKRLLVAQPPTESAAAAAIPEEEDEGDEEEEGGDNNEDEIQDRDPEE